MYSLLKDRLKPNLTITHLSIEREDPNHNIVEIKIAIKSHELNKYFHTKMAATEELISEKSAMVAWMLVSAMVRSFDKEEREFLFKP